MMQTLFVVMTGLAFLILVVVMKNPIKKITSATMAVPKKRLSKAKGSGRLSRWKRKARDVAAKAFNMAKKSLQKKGAEAKKKEVEEANKKKED